MYTFLDGFFCSILRFQDLFTFLAFSNKSEKLFWAYHKNTILQCNSVHSFTLPWFKNRCSACNRCSIWITLNVITHKLNITRTFKPFHGIKHWLNTSVLQIIHQSKIPPSDHEIFLSRDFQILPRLQQDLIFYSKNLFSPFSFCLLNP